MQSKHFLKSPKSRKSIKSKNIKKTKNNSLKIKNNKNEELKYYDNKIDIINRYLISYH